MEQPKRKHRATGHKPPGGARTGSGRPAGTPNMLEYGEASAIRAMKLRVPEDAHPAAVALAGEALETIVKVMRGEVMSEMAPHMRNAAKDIREEVCKPLPKQLNLADANGDRMEVSININRGGK